MAEERRGRRLAQVTLTRRYRVGELPDVQITSGHLVAALKNLGRRDAPTARTLLHLLVGALRQRHKGTDKDLVRVTSKALREETFTDRAAAATVLEMYYTVSSGDDMDGVLARKIVNHCRNLRLEDLGILSMESRVKVAKNSDMDTAEPSSKKIKLSEECDVGAWAALVDLYRSAGDYDSARGAGVLQWSDQPEMTALLEEESSGDFAAARDTCKSLLKERYKDVTELEAGGRLRSIYESYLTALESLSAWDDVVDAMPDAIASNPEKTLFGGGEWRRDLLLPKLVRAETHNMVERTSRKNILFRAVESWREQEDGTKFGAFRRDFGQELALMYLIKVRKADTRLTLESSATTFLSDWSASSDEEATEARLGERLAKLKRLSQLDLATKALDSDKIRTGLLDDWNQKTDLGGFSTLQHCDDLLRDRYVALKAMANSKLLPGGDSMWWATSCRGYLDLVRECNARNDWEVRQPL